MSGYVIINIIIYQKKNKAFSTFNSHMCRLLARSGTVNFNTANSIDGAVGISVTIFWAGGNYEHPDMPYLYGIIWLNFHMASHILGWLPVKSG